MEDRLDGRRLDTGAAGKSLPSSPCTMLVTVAVEPPSGLSISSKLPATALVITVEAVSQTALHRLVVAAGEAEEAKLRAAVAADPDRYIARPIRWGGGLTSSQLAHRPYQLSRGRY